jgi:ring-1,2-phenylacetyl-CoA epoxidase subunit PaaD
VAATLTPGSVLVITTKISADDVLEILEVVVDPDIPVLTIADIGILRDVAIGEDGAVTVFVTPTYSGCPAMAVIEEDITTALNEGGVSDVSVAVRHLPVWTTDWMSDDAKAKLRMFGIAPPDSTLAIVPEILCPRCSSSGAAKVSEFGSTACKSLWVCTSCSEPFDYFKAI